MACDNSFEMNKVLEFGALLASGGQVIYHFPLFTCLGHSVRFQPIYLCNFFIDILSLGLSKHLCGITFLSVLNRLE